MYNGDPCPHCGTATLLHCSGVKCEWRRCPRCHSYGKIGGDFRLYDKGAAWNLYTLDGVQVIDPTRLPAKRKAIAGYTD